MARNGLVYFESYQRELISFSANRNYSAPQLSADPLGGHKIISGATNEKYTLIYRRLLLYCILYISHVVLEDISLEDRSTAFDRNQSSNYASFKLMLDVRLSIHRFSSTFVSTGLSWN
jgi:hypothetical protein